jgi:hypothetical protein
MLTLHQVIPPLTTRTAAGEIVRAWDYKQKKSLLIAFLHGDCSHCRAFVERLSSRASQLTELESAALVVFLESALPPIEAVPPVILTSDTTGRAVQGYLGKDVFGSTGLARVGVFVTDRYGSLFAQWEAREADELPPVADALKWLAHTQIVCEECSTPQWPLGG